MNAIKLSLVVIGVLIPSYAHAGFLTGAVVGGAAGKAYCTPFQKELACIKDKLKDPAWKGKEQEILTSCEPPKRTPLPMKQPEHAPAQPPEQKTGPELKPEPEQKPEQPTKL